MNNILSLVIALTIMASTVSAQTHVKYKVSCIDINSNEITEIKAGSQFWLVIMTADLREPQEGTYIPRYLDGQVWVYGTEKEIGRGVQSAAVGILYDPLRATPKINLTFANSIKWNDFYILGDRGGRVALRYSTPPRMFFFAYGTGENPGIGLVELCRIPMIAKLLPEDQSSVDVTFTPTFMNLSYPKYATNVVWNYTETPEPGMWIRPQNIGVESAKLRINK